MFRQCAKILFKGCAYTFCWDNDVFSGDASLKSPRVSEMNSHLYESSIVIELGIFRFISTKGQGLLIILEKIVASLRMPLDKIACSIWHFLTKTYVVGTPKNRLTERVLWSTQNICLN